LEQLHSFFDSCDDDVEESPITNRKFLDQFTNILGSS